MYELTVKSHFDAAHALRGYPGECRNLHGHTWDVEVTVGGDGARRDRASCTTSSSLKDDLNGVLDRLRPRLPQRGPAVRRAHARPPRTSRA